MNTHTHTHSDERTRWRRPAYGSVSYLVDLLNQTVKFVACHFVWKCLRNVYFTHINDTFNVLFTSIKLTERKSYYSKKKIIRIFLMFQLNQIIDIYALLFAWNYVHTN